jgi:acetoin utilization deacetylase AcuC-like enzyme
MSNDRSSRTVRVFTEPRCLDHRAPRGYPESPDRLTGVTSHLTARGWPITSEGVAREVAEAAVAAVHDPAYVERFRRAAERGDALLDSADNPLSAGTWEAAWAAVSATLAAAEHATEDGGAYAFAAVRPPGHHAEKGLAMGFCFFNNVAVAAQHLRDRGAERVAIFDFDVHHGNGTQHLFEERADVFYASTHQFPFYPGTGAAGETGRGSGRGATLNVPLPAGTGDEEYAEVFAERILPALAGFRPDVLLLSAGFDAWRGDPLGGMAVSEEGFATWGRQLGALADQIAGGRLLAVLEGGYDLANLPLLVDGFLSGLLSRG